MARRASPFTFRPLTPAAWDDFQRLFGPRGACAGCWCTFFRFPKQDWKAGRGEGNRRRQRAYVAGGHVPGLLAYEGDHPVGWVAVEPREAFPVVLASRTTRPTPARSAQGTWAITCFFVSREARGRGLLRALVEAAVAHARRGGARSVEAYPVCYAGRVGASFLYHGTLGTFLAAGFEEVERPAATRPIVVRTLRRPRARRRAG